MQLKYEKDMGRAKTKQEKHNNRTKSKGKLTIFWVHLSNFIFPFIIIIITMTDTAEGSLQP